MKVKSDYTYLQRFQSLSSDDGLGEVDERLSDTGFNMGSIEYADKVTMDLLIRPENEKNVRKLIDDLTAGSAEIVEMTEVIEKI